MGGFERAAYSRAGGGDGFHVSQRTVKDLVPDPERDLVLWDDAQPGFGVRVSKAGVKSYVVSYYADFIQRRYTIAKCSELHAAEARKRAGKIRADARDGIDPLRKREALRGETTMEQLAQRYLDEHAIPHKAASSVKQDRRMIETRLVKIKKLRVSQVSQDDVRALHNALKDSPYEANRVRSLLSKMFSLAIEWKMRSDNPVKGIKRFREDRHEACLTEDEFRRFEEALNGYEVQNAADGLRLLMLTGAREGEVLNADWTQFDLERGTWTRPAHMTKERKTEHVPLSEAALVVLRRMREPLPKKLGKGNGSETKPLLFPGEDGKKPRFDLMNCWRMVCRKAGLSTEYFVEGRRGKPLRRWKPRYRINDLRHSYASFLASGGVSLLVIGRLLGHSSPQTTARYAHCHDHALRAATNSFNELRRA